MTMVNWQSRLRKATRFIKTAHAEDPRVPEPEDDPLVHAIESMIDLEDLLSKEGRVYGEGPVLDALLHARNTLQKNIRLMERAYYAPR